MSLPSISSSVPPHQKSYRTANAQSSPLHQPKMGQKNRQGWSSSTLNSSASSAVPPTPKVLASTITQSSPVNKSKMQEAQTEEFSSSTLSSSSSSEAPQTPSVPALSYAQALVAIKPKVMQTNGRERTGSNFSINPFAAPFIPRDFVATGAQISPAKKPFLKVNIEDNGRLDSAASMQLFTPRVNNVLLSAPTMLQFDVNIQTKVSCTPIVQIFRKSVQITHPPRIAGPIIETPTKLRTFLPLDTIAIYVDLHIPDNGGLQPFIIWQTPFPPLNIDISEMGMPKYSRNELSCSDKVHWWPLESILECCVPMSPDLKEGKEKTVPNEKLVQFPQSV